MGYVEGEKLGDEPQEPRAAGVFVRAGSSLHAGLRRRQGGNTEGGGIPSGPTPTRRRGGRGCRRRDHGAAPFPRRVPGRPDRAARLAVVPLAAARWRDVEVFLRRLAARSAVVERVWWWKVVAGLVERGGRAAAAPPRGIPGGEVHDGAGDARVERRAGVGRGRGGGDRERRVEEQRRHLGVLVLPHRQRVDDARDDDVAPLPRDVRSGGGISENTRERTRVPGARRVQSLALGRERALSVRGRRPGLGV